MKRPSILTLSLLFVFAFFAFLSGRVFYLWAFSQKPLILPLVAQTQAQKFTPGQSSVPSYSELGMPSPTPSGSGKPQGYCLFVPVLMYHHVQPEAVAVQRGQTGLTVDPAYFDQQMNYVVSHGYTPITAEQLVLALKNHTGVPAKSIVVTLDDGYQDNFDYAYPVFQKYHIIANLMVATGLLGGVGNNTYYTWDELKQMVGSGLIFTFDHTWSHYSMGSGTAQKDQTEITLGKQQLETNIGQKQIVFAYPYGAGYNNPRVTQELSSDGFLGAYSTIGGMWQCDSYIYALRRIHVGNLPLSSYGL
ncbi:MAG TPA: polysaccharide deacetylase family protein [Patescibacteria group bacterium]|nr:polysaccharide deacetylase family protein [Patescibacteria group bacterium]